MFITIIQRLSLILRCLNFYFYWAFSVGHMLRQCLSYLMLAVALLKLLGEVVQTLC